MENIDFVKNGINQSGKFELLFKELVKSNFNYKKIFNRKYLETIFGKNAVINSLNKEFYTHFEEIIKQYEEKFNPNNNYFYHQILHNDYNINCLPSYFDNIVDNIVDSKKINYINDNMIDFLKDKTDEYDFIQTSNITDWLSIDEILTFIQNIHTALKDNGYVIMRRLNGDYCLENMLKKNFKIIKSPIDKSMFYSEVVVAQKRHFNI